MVNMPEITIHLGTEYPLGKRFVTDRCVAFVPENRASQIGEPVIAPRSKQHRDVLRYLSEVERRKPCGKIRQLFLLFGEAIKKVADGGIQRIVQLALQGGRASFIGERRGFQFGARFVKNANERLANPCPVFRQ